MSTIPQGRKARYRLAGTDVSGIGVGLERITRNLRYETQRLGGLRGFIASQLLPWRDYSHALAMTSNSVHDPILRDALGEATAWSYEPTAGSGNRVSGMATLIPTLILDPRTGRATWAVRMESDGTPTSAAAPADDRTDQIIQANEATRTTITYTHPGGVADLTPHWESALTIAGLVNTDRRRVVPTGAATTSGITSDPQEVGYQPAIGLRYNADTFDALEDNPEGTLTITRAAPVSWRYTLPVVLTSIDEETPSAAAITYRCQFEPSDAGLPVVAAA